MGDVALLTAVGRLTRDATAEALQGQQGRFAVKFTVASSHYQKGQQDRPTNYYECRMFMGQDRWTNVSQFLLKGRLVCVWGELRPRLAPDNQGGQRLWLNLEEVDFTPIGPRPEEQSAPGQEGQGASQPTRPALPPGAELPLPPGWTQQTDPASGKPYYVSPQGQTQWARPVAAPAAPPAVPPPAVPPPSTPPGGHGAPPGYGGPPNYGPPGYGGSPI
jgi:single-stranded DNA-binding protein